MGGGLSLTLINQGLGSAVCDDMVEEDTKSIGNFIRDKFLGFFLVYIYM